MNMCDLNFQSEVTKMIELEKIINEDIVIPTPIKEVNISDLRKNKSEEYENIPCSSGVSRNVKYSIKDGYYLDTGIDLHTDNSKELKDIVRHSFSVLAKNVTNIGSIEIKGIKRSLNIDIIFNKNLNEFKLFFTLGRQDYMLTYDSKDIDNVLKYILSLKLDEDLTESRVARSLRALWMYQLKEELKETSKQNHIIESETLKEIIDSITMDLTDTRESNIRITYRELFEFFKELRNEHITKNTSKVQEWISFNDKIDINKYLTSHVNYDNIKNIKKEDSEETRKIISQLKSDVYLNRKIKNIYKINDKKESDKSIFTGVHGTPNKSLFSILLNGLKTSTELREENNESFSYTGSGLGDGIYFAQLNQCSKSANYTRSSSNSSYIIIADVEYDVDSKLDVFSYDSSIETKKYSLIHGKKVGSRNLDEIVAPFSDKVNIRYIVELDN